MTSHELARQLLQQEDVPVILYCRESYIYSAVTRIEEVFTRYFEYDSGTPYSKCIELTDR
jgi:hypothetical protein